MNLIKLWRNLPPDTSELLIGLMFSVPCGFLLGQEYGTTAGIATWTALYLLSLIWQALRRLLTVTTIGQMNELRHEMTMARLEAMNQALDEARRHAHAMSEKRPSE